MNFFTALDEVYREIALMKQLNHSNVCSLVEIIDDPNSEKLYVVLENYQNGELM